MQSMLSVNDSELLMTDKEFKSDIWHEDEIYQILTNDDYSSLRYWLAKSNHICSPINATVRTLLLRTIKSIDEKINNQLNEIIHHNSFQKIEASWRGLTYITNQLSEFDSELVCKIKVLNLTWKELSRDVNRAIEFDQSDFFKLIYNNEFNMSGGEPFGLLIGDYQVSHKITHDIPTSDIDTLKGITHTAAAAFAPFVTSADPALFGVDHYSELANVSEIQDQFSQREYQNWRRLREMDDARFLGITIPHILMREPYQNNGTGKEGVYFEERILQPQVDHLWGNAAYGFAAVTLKAFSESGWFSQIRGLQPGQYKRGLVFNLPSSCFQNSKRIRLKKTSVDLQVGDRLEKQLSDSGFIPVSAVPYSDNLVFYSNASVNYPKHYEQKSVRVNARLSSMLQYILCASRFAHYIKAMGRDKVGMYTTAESLENEFQHWLFDYTTASDESSDEIRSRYPLNEARIQVREKSGQPGKYYSIIHLRPHFQLDQMISSIRLITELSPRQNNVG
ncbi:type VI secretion system contractile sheath large subunit [Photobacterium makurazakiensis]|uniref:type VI secretion system contractile sheath large subunit n=1 Tax=Photobacterium makurazakiensis TaxID=2910234 RepID=UPI003D0DB977